jgi:hypothetical protein
MLRMVAPPERFLLSKTADGLTLTSDAGYSLFLAHPPNTSIDKTRFSSATVYQDWSQYDIQSVFTEIKVFMQVHPRDAPSSDVEIDLEL